MVATHHVQFIGAPPSATVLGVALLASGLSIYLYRNGSAVAGRGVAAIVFVLLGGQQYLVGDVVVGVLLLGVGVLFAGLVLVGGRNAMPASDDTG